MAGKTKQHGVASRAVEASLRRIAALDGEVRAFVLIDAPGAVAAAQRRDLAVEGGHEPGALHGFTIGAKDIIDTRGMVTACGSPILAGRVPERDAAVVSRLRRAGGVIVGKTVTTQFAAFDPGPTRNPWDLTHTPGGSSSGSAAAVAAGMVRAAIGTQTAGSVIRPAAYCGVVAYVPAPGLLSLDGIYPLSPSFDRVGVFARSVADVAEVTGALIRRPRPGPAPARRGAMGPTLGEHVRVGVLSKLWDRASAPAVAAVETAARILEGDGYRLRETAAPDLFEEGFRAHATMMRAEIASTHRELYRRHRAEYGPRITSLIRGGLQIRAVDYLAARGTRDQYREQMDRLLEAFELLLLPAAVGPAESGLAVTGDPVMNVPAMVAGLPAMTVPVALTGDGLPIGVQLLAAREGEHGLFEAARRIERAIAFDIRPAHTPEG